MTSLGELYIVRTGQDKTITTELVLELCGPDFDSLNFEIWIVSRASLSLELPLPFLLRNPPLARAANRPSPLCLSRVSNRSLCYVYSCCAFFFQCLFLETSRGTSFLILHSRGFVFEYSSVRVKNFVSQCQSMNFIAGKTVSNWTFKQNGNATF